MTEDEAITEEKFNKLVKDMSERKEHPSCFVLGKNGIKALEKVFNFKGDCGLKG